MIRIKVTSGSRRKVFYVRDDFINAPKPDRTQMKKEAEEFIEYIRTEHKKVEAEVPNKTTATWEDEALEEVLSKLRAIPDSYEGFVLGIYTYVRKKPERLERVMNYINNNMDVTSSDVVEYVLQQPDFHEDGVSGIIKCGKETVDIEKRFLYQKELAKALYLFSDRKLTVEQAEERAEIVMRNLDFQNEGLGHKGFNWIAKQILKKMDGVNINYKPEKQLIEEGLQALEERLGIVGTIRFLQQFDNDGSGDYTKEKYGKGDEPTEEEMAKLLSEWLAEGEETT